MYVNKNEQYSYSWDIPPGAKRYSLSYSKNSPKKNETRYEDDYSVRSQILRKMAKMQLIINNEQLTINKVKRAADFLITQISLLRWKKATKEITNYVLRMRNEKNIKKPYFLIF